MAATGILAAERRRNRSGNGELVNLALSDVGIWVASALGHLAESALLGRSREADGNHIYGAFGHDFVTKDNCGDHVNGPYQSPMEATKNCYENRECCC